eukprot:CAMPEP_0178482104 /NCGR_PEP_ID=MMETSP0696-20121128/6555_1 /TAXON_ID=265572 /ORGANISM="Extubocellulus spinifer, Strain CCMP396" /LENGTH=72 /DNA_ID=CAMNT_0020109597 /DNA_START=1438 /DNA_END=1656 /DNA_ORIENTATION=+
MVEDRSHRQCNDDDDDSNERIPRRPRRTLPRVQEMCTCDAMNDTEKDRIMTADCREVAETARELSAVPTESA